MTNWWILYFVFEWVVGHLHRMKPHAIHAYVRKMSNTNYKLPKHYYVATKTSIEWAYP